MLRKVYEDVRKSELKPLVSAREDADHFICLVERKNLDLDMLTGMCQKKLTRGGKTLHLSVKCGIFMLEKKKMSVNGMIDRAKIAQRYITDEFVQSYKIYDSSMKNTYIDKATLAGELEEGIEQGQFKVYFQPVVDAMTGKIASAESLIRWFHPKKGFISPGVFIPALEKSGHISDPAVFTPTTSPVSSSRKSPGERVSIAVRSALPSTGGCGICAVAMMTFFKQSEGVPMQTINLKQYYPFCKEDIFVEVSDEIVEAFLLDKRAEAARDRKMFRYKAFYSLDCNDGIENAAIGWAQPSPEDYLIEKEELAEYEELIRRLYEAISSLPPMQARRVHARYMLGMKVKDIAAMEGITPSQAGKSIHAALRRLRRYFARQKWTVKL